MDEPPTPAESLCGLLRPGRTSENAMKPVLFVVTLCTLVAVGCAHGPQPASPQAFSDPPVQAVTIVPASYTAQQIAASPQLAQNDAMPGTAAAGAPPAGPDADTEDFDPTMSMPSAERATIADPLEPYNRAMFTFNDRMYFWLLKPVAQGYKAVIPEPARVSVSNFFYNLRYPVRAVSCLLQLDFPCFVIVSTRFVINTTLGIAGLFDPASSDTNLQKRDVDLGQTLGMYGVGQGFYFIWPVVGPSSPRDTIGLVGDFFLYPVSYLDPWYVWLAVRGYQEINSTSLVIGDYEAFKEAAIDPYVSMRNAWTQYRQKKVDERSSPEQPDAPPGVPRF
jgi:phospholipid-binding lipoprotein MlaA